jgi:hypothetical protein
MDYEKAYKDALGRAKNLMTMYPQDAPGYKEVFPELHESEDERIIRTIKTIVNCAGESGAYDFMDGEYDAIWNWLEKQKEQKIVERNEEDESIRRDLIDFLADCTNKKHIVVPERFFVYLEKQKEQKPVEWSEEDERMLTGIIERGSSQVPFGEPALRWEQIDWLMNRLKSLRPQPHWKPGEEQIRSLEYFIKLWGATDAQLEYVKIYGDVKELYGQLKKLT